MIGSLFGSPDGDEEIDPSQVGVASSTVLFGFGVRDAAAYSAGWEKVLKAGGSLFTWNEEIYEHAGVEVHAMNDWAWALSDDTFFTGFGEASRDWLEAVLAHRRSVLVDGALPLGLPRDVERRMRYAPPGVQGCGAFDVRSLIGVPVFELLDLEERTGEFLGDGWAEVFESLRPFLERHQLDRAYGYAAWSDDRWSYRVVW